VTFNVDLHDTNNTQVCDMPPSFTNYDIAGADAQKRRPLDDDGYRAKVALINEFRLTASTGPEGG